MANVKSITRAAFSVCLIGGTEEHFKTTKLPSRGEVLKVLFKCHIEEKMSLKDSFDKTSLMLLFIWAMARIPTKASTHVVEHLAGTEKAHTSKFCHRSQAPTDLQRQSRRVF